MNVSLTPKLEEYVRNRVASGLYNNASEVIREALRLLVERDGSETEAPAPPVMLVAPEMGKVFAQLATLEKPLRKRGVVSLALFGSVVRGTAGPRSDVDVLIRIAPDTLFSLVDLAAVRGFLEGRLGRPVDVVTREGLDPLIRDRVLREAREVF